VRERERERDRKERTHAGERVREKALWLLLLYVFSSTWACPMQIGLSQECCLFCLKSSLWSSDLPLTFYPLPDKIHLRTDTTFTIRISCKKSYTLLPFPSSYLNKSKVWGTGGVGIKKKGRYVFFSHLEVCVTWKTPQCPMSASLC